MQEEIEDENNGDMQIDENILAHLQAALSTNELN